MSKASEYITVSKLQHEITELQYALILKSDKAFEKLLNKLSNAIVNSYDTKRTDALNKAIDYLTSLPDDTKFSKEIAGEVDSILSFELGKNLEEIVSEPVIELNQQIYKSGIHEVSKNINMKLAFDVPDINAAKILASHNLFYIKDYYNSHLSDEIKEILKGYLTETKTIKEVSEDFYNKFAEKSEKGKAYFEGLAEHTASRTRELGKITGFEKAGIEYYEIRAIIDDRTSEICLSMNGRIFPVADGVSMRDSILSMSDPEEIKSIAPWRPAEEIENISTSELPDGMELPPYHFRCRTVTVVYPYSEFQTEFLIPPEEKIQAIDSVLTNNKMYDAAKKIYSSKADSNQLLRNLIPDELGSILSYYSRGNINIFGQSKFHEILNQYCNHSLSDLTESENEFLRNSRELLNIALTKLRTDYSGFVYRGIKGKYDLSKYIEGNIITEEQFISSTSNRNKSFVGQIMFTIKSKSGKLINQFSGFKDENEVLFRAGTKYLVTKNVIENKIREIEIEEI